MVIYSVAIGLYLLNGETLEVPREYRGGPADPATYMTPEQMEQALAYSRTKDVVFFLGTPYEWLVYLLILGLGLSAAFQRLSEKWGGIRSLKTHYPTLRQTAVFMGLFLVIYELLQFPISYYVFQLQHEYGISTQPFSSWMGDKGKGVLISFAIGTPVVWLLYRVIAASPRRWWFWFWLASIPILILLMFIQPVVLDPLFNEFRPLQDQALKRDILALADQADIPADQVYEVDMSKKTTAMNAYVTGIGSNARIVLWDTTLQKMDRGEVMFVMAHEMGHYVYKHVQWILIGTIAMMFVLLYLLYRLLGGIVRRWGRHWGIEKVGSLSSLPLILLVVSVISFATSPINNMISRSAERAADQYGIEMTRDTDAAISAFQKLAVSGLVEPSPPALVKFFRYTHPTLVERIQFLQDYEARMQFLQKRDITGEVIREE